MAKTMKESIDGFRSDLKENTTITNQISQDVKVANGRTRKLEDWSNEAKIAIEALLKSNETNRDMIVLMDSKHRSDVRAVKWVVGIAAFFLFSFALMLQQNIKTYNEKLLQDQQDIIIKATADKVVTNLEEKFNLKIQ